MVMFIRMDPILMVDSALVQRTHSHVITIILQESNSLVKPKISLPDSVMYVFKCKTTKFMHGVLVSMVVLELESSGPSIIPLRS